MWSRQQFPMKLCNFWGDIDGGDGLKFHMDTILHIGYHSVTTNATIAIITIGSRPTSEYKLIFSVTQSVDVIVHPGFCVDLSVIRVINGNTITKINHVAVLRPRRVVLQCIYQCNRVPIGGDGYFSSYSFQNTRFIAHHKSWRHDLWNRLSHHCMATLVRISQTVNTFWSVDNTSLYVQCVVADSVCNRYISYTGMQILLSTLLATLRFWTSIWINHTRIICGWCLLSGVHLVFTSFWKYAVLAHSRLSLTV